MKLRIKDNAVRFRITLKELEQFQASGRLGGRTLFPGVDGHSVEFRYSAFVDPSAEHSRVEPGPFEIRMILSQKDFDTLCAPDQEGAYLRQEWTDAAGTSHRFMAFIEKDRPGSTCDKPEEWIYEEVPGQPPRTRPIPRDQVG